MPACGAVHPASYTRWCAVGMAQARVWHRCVARPDAPAPWPVVSPRFAAQAHSGTSTSTSMCTIRLLRPGSRAGRGVLGSGGALHAHGRPCSCAATAAASMSRCVPATVRATLCTSRRSQRAGVGGGLVVTSLATTPLAACAVVRPVQLLQGVEHAEGVHSAAARARWGAAVWQQQRAQELAGRLGTGGVAVREAGRRRDAGGAPDPAGVQGVGAYPLSSAVGCPLHWALTRLVCVSVAT